MSKTTVEVDGHELALSNLDKVLYPEADFTKGDVLNYYAAISPYILPHLQGRPLTLKRYPGGVTGEFFYEKRCPSHKPAWVSTIRVASESRGEPINYCEVDAVSTLMWVANLASLELHVLLSKNGNVKRPTMMVFDLDPGPPADMLDCIRIGFKLREMLAELKLECFAKTSGGKGLHIYTPLNTPSATFDRTKDLARKLAQKLETDSPGLVLSKMSKALRAGKVFVDWSQNDEHKTTACVYSLRARPRPTVSTPVTWDELKSALRRKKADALLFEAPAVVQRVKKLGDLFAPVQTLKQKLPAKVNF